MYYLTVFVGQMSGLSVAQVVLLLESHKAKKSRCHEGCAFSRSSGDESTFKLIQVAVRIQFLVGPKPLFPWAVWGCSQFLEANHNLDLQSPSSVFKARKGGVSVSYASTLSDLTSPSTFKGSCDYVRPTHIL